MALNAAAAVGRVISAAAQNKAVTASAETIQARKSICLACESCRAWEKDANYHRCVQCGCWLDGAYFSKWALAPEQCPLGKWEAVT